MGSNRYPVRGWPEWSAAWFYFDLRCGFAEASVYACSVERRGGFQRITVQYGGAVLMARPKPDIGAMERALPRAALAARGAFRFQRAQAGTPETFWMRPAHYAEMIQALRGSGFDVARGVVLDGVPVKPYAA